MNRQITCDVSVTNVHVAQHELDFAPPALALFRRLTENGQRRHTALLESAEPGSRKTQRSLLVTSAALSIACRGPEIVVEALNENGRAVLPLLIAHLTHFEPIADNDRLTLRAPPTRRDGTDHERLMQPSVLCVLRAVIEKLAATAGAPPDAVFLIGVFGYELAAQFEAMPEPAAAVHASDFPDYVFVLADELVSIDHLAGRARVLAMRFGDAVDDKRRVTESAVQRIVSTAQEVHAAAPDAHRDRPPGSIEAVTCDRDDAAFGADVVTLKRHIFAGDVFQIVPSRTFAMPCRDPMDAYAALHALNPSPYLFYFNGASPAFADSGADAAEFVLFGASPESAIKVDAAQRRVDISPIAGTRPRGLRADGSVDEDLDSRYETELRLDTKETAEHMMLVDLARNDIARIANPGTRQVAELMHIVRYSHVMHLASRVGGQLRDDLDALHTVQACLNMGTLTGAPKIRAMQLLRSVEPGRRGHYGGAIGYLRGDGSMDTAIVIRAALVQDGIARVRAGAGVVHDSVPLLEAAETRRKAEAVLRAIALANAAGDQPVRAHHAYAKEVAHVS